MSREILVFALLYAFTMLIHSASVRYGQYRERQRKLHEDEDALTPLDVFGNIARAGYLASVRGGRLISLFVAGVANPATIEAAKHYVVHFLIYSGYVVPPH